MGPSLYQYPERFNAPIHVRNEELIFPVMILYPESSQSDYVREMSEEDTFADLFNVHTAVGLNRRCCTPPGIIT